MKIRSVVKQVAVMLCTALGALLASSCSNHEQVTADHYGSKLTVSVKDQKLLLTQLGKPVKSYPVSTSKFGLGDYPNSMRTPMGRMKVAKKIGHGAPSGAVFKSRHLTGEVLQPNAPGRDPIVSRIMWLKGDEHKNRNAYARYIYIHGTPEEKNIGKPASYGCIRMKSDDVIDLYNRIGVGAVVEVIDTPLSRTRAGRAYARQTGSAASAVLAVLKS